MNWHNYATLILAPLVLSPALQICIPFEIAQFEAVVRHSKMAKRLDRQRNRLTHNLGISRPPAR